MGAPVGNEYYKLRSKDGRDRIYSNPEELINEANEYFQWIQDNPFLEAQIVNRPFKKKSDIEGDPEKYVPYSVAELPKMRPMTLEGLCNYLDIAVNTFREYEKREDFLPITTRIKQIIDTQQFEGAASGFLNPNIIARKLGLTDKQDHTHNVEGQVFKINGQEIKF